MSANFSLKAEACSSNDTALGWTLSNANVKTSFLALISCIVSSLETKSARTGRVMTRETDSATMASRKEVRFEVRVCGLAEVV